MFVDHFQLHNHKVINRLTVLGHAGEKRNEETKYTPLPQVFPNTLG